MEFIKNEMQMECKKGRVSTQVTFDEAYNLPEYLPDIYSVILTRKNTRLDEVRPGNGYVLLRGAVMFQVLYRTDQNAWHIAGLEGELPFQEKLVMDNLEEFDLVTADARAEDLSVQIINSRKLNIRALLELTAAVSERCDAELPSEPAADENTEVWMQEQVFLALKYSGKETARIREEISIPSNKPNIGQILWQQAQVFGIESRVSAGEVALHGEIRILVIYAGEDEGSLQWIAEKIPFGCMFEIPEADAAQISYITVDAQKFSCSVGTDADGEARMLLVEGVLVADIRLYEEETREILRDTYALDRTLLLRRQETPVMRLCMKNESRQRVSGTMTVNDSDGSALQTICAGFGDVEIDRREIVENGVDVEGAVHVQILYLTDQDSRPVEAMEGLLPFAFTVEIPGILPGDEVKISESVENLSFLMKNGKEAEVQAEVSLTVLAIHPETLELIAEIDEKPLNIEAFTAQPSIVGLTLAPEDSLWEIAKKYHTTKEKIQKTNGLETDQPAAGTRILLVKQLPTRV